jgi:hypothetical protein
LGSKHESRDFTISLVPWRPKLITAGQQTSIPESDIWRCTNAGPDFDGLLSMRPGIAKWGQTLKYPNSSATGSTRIAYVDFLSGTGGFVHTDASAGKVTHTTTKGSLQTSVAAGSANENYLMSYSVASLSASTKWSTRFMFRGQGLPVYTAAGTVANTFSIRAQGATSSAKEFAIWLGGLYWKRASNNQYTFVTGTEWVGAGSWHSIEIRCDDAAGNTLVYVDDILVQTLLSADLKDVTITGTSAFEMRWEVSGVVGTPYSTYVADLGYNDTATAPFPASTVVALTDYQYLTGSGAQFRVLLVAAGNYIYHDQGLEGAWRPLHPKQFTNVWFAPYRTTMVWTDNNGGSISNLWQWNGETAPTLLNAAPEVRFVTEHQQRLFGWGDILNPRRLYYSGDRLPNLWFNPSPSNTGDQFDQLIDAGYLEIPSRGVEVRAVYGDYHGRIVIGAEKGFWTLSGAGPLSYSLDGIKVKTGATNAHSMDQVGNDIWAIGLQGIASLSATDQFGDIMAAFPSVPIQNLWRPDVSSTAPIQQTFIDKSRLVYHAGEFVYLAVPLIGDQSAKKIYIYNTTTQGFYGPWEVDARSMASVVLASPITEVLMTGGESGQVGYFNPFSRLDYSTTQYTMDIETPSYNGRSLDPRYVSLHKTWKQLRLIVLPRGKWTATLKWWTDEDTTEQTKTIDQPVVNGYYLDEDFRLDENPDSFLRAGEDLITVPVDLTARGKNLTINLQSSNDWAIQGIEIDGTVAGYEGE